MINRDKWISSLPNVNTKFNKVTNQLALLDINIEELKTNIQNAPMSGLALFSLTAN